MKSNTSNDNSIEVAEEQAKYEVWSEVIKWVEKGQAPDKSEVRGKSREVLVGLSNILPYNISPDNISPYNNSPYNNSPK